MLNKRTERRSRAPVTRFGTPSDSTGPGAVELLRGRSFGLFFVGNLISNSGTWFHSVAQVLLVYRLTGSTVIVGLVGSAQFAGTFLVAPWAGSMADRLDRRRLAMLMAALSAALSGCLAGLVAADLATTPIVLAIAVAIGLAWAFTAPGLQAMIPSLVEPAALPQATALHSLSFNLARAIGPALSAVIIARFDLAVAFAVNSASFLRRRGTRARPTSPISSTKYSWSSSGTAKSAWRRRNAPACPLDDRRRLSTSAKVKA